MSSGIAIYVVDGEQKEIAAWLATLFDSVESIERMDASGIYHAYFGGRTLPIIVTERMEDGPFCEIWFNASATPWDSSLECARAAFRYFGREIRCEAGASPIDPYQWWHITCDGEGRVFWGSPEK